MTLKFSNKKVPGYWRAMEVFREVAVEASTFKDRERSYFSRQHDDAAERRPDAVVAGSVYYYAPGKYTNNRFIVWCVTLCCRWCV